MTQPSPRDEVLRCIRTFVVAHGYPPTTREITSALGLSSTRVTHELLVSLRDEGKVEWDEGRARTLRVLTDDELDGKRASG